MEQNQTSKIQKLLNELTLMEQSFINNVATQQQYAHLKQLSAELYLLADLASDPQLEPSEETKNELPPVRTITDFYHPVDMDEELEHESSNLETEVLISETPSVQKVEVESVISTEEQNTQLPLIENVSEKQSIDPIKVAEEIVSPISNDIQLGKLLSLNKKFEYTRGLFGGDGSQLDAFLKEASSQKNKANVKTWFNEKISAKDWGNKTEMCDEFLIFMQRHLP